MTHSFGFADHEEWKDEKVTDNKDCHPIFLKRSEKKKSSKKAVALFYSRF